MSPDLLLFRSWVTSLATNTRPGCIMQGSGKSAACRACCGRKCQVTPRTKGSQCKKRYSNTSKTYSENNPQPLQSLETTYQTSPLTRPSLLFMRQICSLVRITCTRKFQGAPTVILYQNRSFRCTPISFLSQAPHGEGTMAQSMTAKNGQPFNRASLESVMRRRL